MADLETLKNDLTQKIDSITHYSLSNSELTVEIPAEQLSAVCLQLRQDALFAFDCLVDICGVDYLHYGLSEWQTESATATGFERGVAVNTEHAEKRNKPERFAVVYHFLSLPLNHRLRLRVFLPEHDLKVSSVTDIWPAAQWFEREVFDLFGIVFTGHTDLRRILTDYGFQGHPFRKDFPLSGKVEVRYDAKEGRVVYQPVSIAPRILEPKVIRTDPRYENGET